MPFTIAQQIRKFHNQKLALIRPAQTIRDLPGPLPSFDAMRFPDSLQKYMRNFYGEIIKPTEWQTQALPLMLQGSNLISYGQNLVGKTVAYICCILLTTWHHTTPLNWTIVLSSKEQASQVQIQLKEMHLYLRKKHTKTTTLCKINIKQVISQTEFQEIQIGKDHSNIIITYDKYAKKIGEKCMGAAEWRVVLDLDQNRLGKYVEDYLYQCRKMAVQKVAQIMIFSNGSDFLKFDEIHKILKSVRNPVAILQQNDIQTTKQNWGLQYLSSESETFQKLQILLKKLQTPIIVMSSSSKISEDVYNFLKSKTEKIGILNSEPNAQKMDQLERSEILIINDKYLSKLVLTFDFHENKPTNLINLDFSNQYCSIFKRLTILNQDKLQNCQFLLSKESCSYKSLVSLKQLFISQKTEIPSLLDQVEVQTEKEQIQNDEIDEFMKIVNQLEK